MNDYSIDSACLAEKKSLKAQEVGEKNEGSLQWSEGGGSLRTRGNLKIPPPSWPYSEPAARRALRRHSCPCSGVSPRPGCRETPPAPTDAARGRANSPFTYPHAWALRPQPKWESFLPASPLGLCDPSREQDRDKGELTAGGGECAVAQPPGSGQMMTVG